MTELEQFCILARTQKSRACAALIQQVLSHRKIYVFGELLDQPSVQSLKEGEFAKSYNSLELFAYGTFKDYQANPDTYLELSEAQLTKLKQLTLVSLASTDKVLSYETLLVELSIDSVRQLEDLIIEAMYAGLLSGKLDPAHGVLRVKATMARDVKIVDISELIDTLTAWRGNIADFAAQVVQSSAYMSQQRQAGEAEQKSAAETIERRKKEIKDAVETGDPLDEALFAITGEDVLGGVKGGGGGGSAAGKGPGGGGSRVDGPGQAGGKSKLAHQGHRPSAGKHPRHQQNSVPSMGGGGMFGRR